MSILELQKLIITFRDERDRKQFHNPKDLANAIIIESGELLEHYLRKNQNDSFSFSKGNEEIEDEFADIMNYLLLFAESCGINIEKAVKKKIEKNRKKYPVGKFRGNSLKYDKL